MMSLVGCSGEEFESILKSLGYKKHTVKRKRPVTEEKPAEETVEPTRALTPESAETATALAQAPAAEPVEKLEADASAGDATAMALAAAPAVETVEPTAPAETSSPETGETASNNDAGAPATETADTSSTPAEAENATQQTVQDAAETIGADQVKDVPAEETEEIEVTLWRFVPRRPPVKKQGGRRDNAKGKGKNAKGGPRKGGPKTHSPYKGSPKNLPKKGAEGHAPRHRKVADPNSPFAVLAGLKDGLPEKPEKS